MLDVRKLQALQAVARHGSITAAARALHFTAPAISQQLAALERETDASLFVRTGRSIRLTDAGLLLAAHADIVLTQLAAASAALASSRAPSGPLTIAAFPTAVASIVAPALGSLHRRYPGIDGRLIEAEPERAEQLLQSGSADVGVVHHYDLLPRIVPGVVESEALFDEQMLLALPDEASHPRSAATEDAGDGEADDDGRAAQYVEDPWAQAGPIDIRSLRSERWIVPPLGTTCHELVQRACGAAGFVPDIGAQCNDYRSTLSLVRAGCGVALVPASALDRLALDGVTIRRTAEPLRRYVSVQTLAGRRSPSAASFIESLRALELRSIESARTFESPRFELLHIG